jgi:hypothetical protein
MLKKKCNIKKEFARFDTQFTVERRAGLRSEALLLKADAITVEDEEEISQNLATTPKTRQELYRSERRIRPLLHRRRAQGPRGGEAAGTSAGRVVASLFALDKKRRERKVGVGLKVNLTKIDFHNFYFQLWLTLVLHWRCPNACIVFVLCV